MFFRPTVNIKSPSRRSLATICRLPDLGPYLAKNSKCYWTLNAFQCWIGKAAAALLQRTAAVVRLLPSTVGNPEPILAVREPAVVCASGFRRLPDRTHWV